MSLTFDSARIPNPHLTEDHLAGVMRFAVLSIKRSCLTQKSGTRRVTFPLSCGQRRPRSVSWCRLPRAIRWYGDRQLAQLDYQRRALTCGCRRPVCVTHGPRYWPPPVINWGTEEMKAEIAPPVFAANHGFLSVLPSPGWLRCCQLENNRCSRWRSLHC